ncbi:MAG TPA: radical SAM protein [Cytophagaceae bacterium]|nr:radical SAM protein [Cytophagaceae bacterium]
MLIWHPVSGIHHPNQYMNQILFTHSYFLKLDPKQWKTMQPYPPLATLYAASLMRTNGYMVRLFDPMFSESPSEIIPALQNQQPDIVVIYDDGFNYLTKMCLTNMREAAFEIIRFSKEQNAVVIVSSSDASDHYEKYLAQGADYVIIGEAEEILLELTNCLAENNIQALSSLKGIAYKENGSVHHTGRREVLKDLDALPAPAWDLVNIEEYRHRWIEKNGYFSLNMVTTRGCPYKCNWCAKPIYGNRYTSHSAERKVEELKFLLEQYKPDHIWFCDDIFGLKPGWLKTFSEKIKEAKLNFRYKIQSRADLLVEENTVQYLAESGCETVWLGAESGSQKILDAMDKGITLAQICEARKLLHKYKIRCAFFLQFGYLGETNTDEASTIRMVLDLMPDEIGISVSYPLPGTKFYEKVKNELKHKANWTDSDDLSMMFRADLPADYYKQLQRYVHKIYQKQRGLNNFRGFLKKPSDMNYQKLRSIAGIAWYGPYAWLTKNKLKRSWQ